MPRTPAENLYAAVCNKTKRMVHQPVLKALRRGVIQAELPQEEEYLATLSILLRNRNIRREVCVVRIAARAPKLRHVIIHAC